MTDNEAMRQVEQLIDQRQRELRDLLYVRHVLQQVQEERRGATMPAAVVALLELLNRSEDKPEEEKPCAASKVAKTQHTRARAKKRSRPVQRKDRRTIIAELVAAKHGDGT